MAVVVLCSVYDNAVEAFSNPFVCKSRGEAIRSFQDALKDDKLPFSAHPEDYSLHVICEFDDQSGAVKSCFERLMRAADVK